MPDHKITQVMMDDNTIDASKEIKMVLSIANTLRGPYRAENYKDVIIPMIILRRLECALAKTKKAVVAAYKKNPKAPAQLRAALAYRVSTKGQVDHDDIPMQKIDCRKFAQKQGWPSSYYILQFLH